MHTIVGTFYDTAEAQRAVQDLMAIGFTNDDISLVFSDAEGRYSSQLTGTEVREHDTGDAAATGAVLGGVEGGLIGLALGLGAFAIPGLGPIIGMGPILAGLIGAGTGAATGGITGALVERGISDDEADYYAEAVRRGYTLLVVDTPEGREDEVMDIMENYDVVDIDERAEYWTREGWTGYDARAGAYTPDQVTAERDHYLRSRTGATAGVRHYPVSESYRTDVNDYRTSGYTSDYDVYTSDFRNHYNQYWGTSGRAYTDYEPAYRYGYDLAMDRRYANYDWVDLEPEARRRWESEYHREGVWEDFKDSVRYAWERVKATVA